MFPGPGPRAGRGPLFCFSPSRRASQPLSRCQTHLCACRTVTLLSRASPSESSSKILQISIDGSSVVRCCACYACGRGCALTGAPAGYGTKCSTGASFIGGKAWWAFRRPRVAMPVCRQSPRGRSLGSPACQRSTKSLEVRWVWAKQTTRPSPGPRPRTQPPDPRPGPRTLAPTPGRIDDALERLWGYSPVGAGALVGL